MNWAIHWLEASGDLRAWHDVVAREIEEARRAMSLLVRGPSVDILVQRMPDAVIPEMGMAGRSWRKNLVLISLDPDSAHFSSCLRDGALRRIVVHEAHHCLRMGACGYGRTLGEALTSEGLAGHFVRRVFASPPEPWENAVSDDVISRLFPDSDALAEAGYDHRAWFFGKGGRFPRWFGYTLGYRMVCDWLAHQSDVSADAWISVSAAEVMAAMANHPWQSCTRNKSLFASFSSEKEDSSLF